LANAKRHAGRSSLTKEPLKNNLYNRSLAVTARKAHSEPRVLFNDR
jgi:hypothetical protein